MFTVKEVQQMTGVSIRTLRYYDQIGLLKPSDVSAAGYRLYDETALERLQQILLYRELQFPLKEIRRILESPDFDRSRALKQQMKLLEMKKAHLENLIALARGIQLLGVKYMDFSAFDTSRIDEYADRARASWGKTDAYREFEQKQQGRTPADDRRIANALMQIFVEFGAIRHAGPGSAEAQAMVEKLRAFITAHYYNCTKQILSSLGKMYGGGGEFTENINRAAGDGAAEFAAEAIAVYCRE